MDIWGGVSIPEGEGISMSRSGYPPPGHGTYPPPIPLPATNATKIHMVGKQAVRILLECFRVEPCSNRVYKINVSTKF